jgi:pimeloyl-ACP methyl ester carboxylesterase
MVNFISLPPERRSKTGLHVLVYFVSGNPGLVGYYQDFLQSLRYQLSLIEGDIAFHLYGTGLYGFKDDDHTPFTSESPPYIVEDQICLLYENIASQRIAYDLGDGRKGTSYDFVILMGHSVGSYLCLEITHRHLKDPSAAPHLKIRHGIFICPTVTHIAQSPRGKNLVLLSKYVALDRYAHIVAKLFLLLWPAIVLNWILRYILKFSPTSAAVTVEFLKSRDGVWQALHLGKDEMRVICEDKWDESLWEIPVGAEVRHQPVPKFFFYYTQDDHWVSDHFRDQFVKERNAHAARDGPEHKRGQTRMIFSKGYIPHAFCTKQSRYCL